MKRAWLTMATALVLGSAAAKAGPDDRPTVSVLPFTASRGMLSPAETAELSDDLAERLVETGRYRVLPREWLTPEDDEPADLTALRDAARHAGVRYLVSPSVTGLSARPSPAPRALSGAARAILALGASRRAPVPCGPARSRQSFALVEATVIDADTAAIVRTSSLRVRLSGPTAITTGCARSMTVPAAALIAARARPGIDRFKEANQEIANSLSLPDRQEHAANRQE